MSALAPPRSPPPTEEAVAFGPLEYARAVLNILEDSGVEKARLLETPKGRAQHPRRFQRREARLLDMQKAVLNILGRPRGREAATRARPAGRASFGRRASHVPPREGAAPQRNPSRVKNNLQIISSLLVLQARHLADPEARAILGESQNRVRSIALVHEKLYQSTDLAHIDLGEYSTL